MIIGIVFVILTIVLGFIISPLLGIIVLMYWYLNTKVGLEKIKYARQLQEAQRNLN